MIPVGHEIPKRPNLNDPERDNLAGLLIFTLILVALLVWSCNAHAKKSVRLVPAHCVEITAFDKPCQPKIQGHDWVCDKVHMVVRPLPECNEFNNVQFLTIGKPHE